MGRAASHAGPEFLVLSPSLEQHIPRAAMTVLRRLRHRNGTCTKKHDTTYKQETEWSPQRILDNMSAVVLSMKSYRLIVHGIVLFHDLLLVPSVSMTCNSAIPLPTPSRQQVEIRAIVAKRRDFEYMLRRHEARKLDFMRYAEHELNLESLRALRTKKIEGSSAANNKKRKKKSTKGGAASDYTCIRLVRWIFDRAVMKFPGDVDIWLHYIDFAARLGQSKVQVKSIRTLTSHQF